MYIFSAVDYSKRSLDRLIPKLEDCGEPRFDTVTSTRIIGGNKADPGQFPYMALLYRIDTETDEEEYYCAGTIINQFYILTAAHCVLTNQNTTTQLYVNVNDSMSELKLRLPIWKFKNSDQKPNFVFRAFILVGITDVSERCHKNGQLECLNERRYEVKESIVHPKYVYGSRDRSHDIALIRTKLPIELNKEYIRPVCLPLPRIYGFPDTLRGNVDEKLRTSVVGAGLVAGWGRQSSKLYRSRYVMTS